MSVDKRRQVSLVHILDILIQYHVSAQRLNSGRMVFKPGINVIDLSTRSFCNMRIC